MKFIVDTSAHTIAPVDGRHDAISWFTDEGFSHLSDWWLRGSFPRKYSYQFRWLGTPIIQLPTDMIMMQDLICRIRPTLIIETGIAHGGSVLFHASILELLHARKPSPSPRPHVIAIDIDIRSHNRKALDEHWLRPMVTLIESSSTDEAVISNIRRRIHADDIVMVVLDSNHSREHVLSELRAYAPLVTNGSAMVAMDGVMPRFADLPGGAAAWKGDNPEAAIQEFLRSPEGACFSVDHSYQQMFLTHSPGGILTKRAN